MRTRGSIVALMLGVALLCLGAVDAWAGSGGGSGGVGLLAKGAVPEPASLIALASGVGGILVIRWRKRK